ncbi:MAG: hypothetical protein AABY14_00820, partial [Nanoarchaeota archaeon]
PSQIIDGIAGVGAYSAADLETNSRNRTIEFILFNEKPENLTNINWTINFGDGSANSNTPINLSEGITVIVQNNYSVGGLYNINISTNADQNIIQSQFGVKAKSVEVISRNKTETLAEFTIQNTIAEQGSNGIWNCSEGLSSTLDFSHHIEQDSL